MAIQSPTRYRIALEGVAGLDELPVREIAAFLDAIPTLVSIAAADVLGRPAPRHGRYETPIEEASRIRLTGLTTGSIVAEIRPAPIATPVGGMELSAESLSDRALDLLVTVAEGNAAQHPAVGRGLVTFFDQFAGSRPGGVIRLTQDRGRGPREVLIDRERREVISRQVVSASVPPVTTRDVTGRLFEANLETRSAQVRTPSGERVDVQFGPEHEPAIRNLLGGRAQFTGEVTFDRRTNRAKTVHVRQILTGVQLGLNFGGVDFWVDRPVLDLVREASARPVADPDALELAGLSDAEWEALTEALGLGE